HWNDAADAWLKPAQQAELEPLRNALLGEPEDTPVVFVVDDEAPEEVRIYGFAKLAGNVTRYAVPGSMQDLTGYYLGSLESYQAREPSERGDDDYYRELSQESLDDVEEVTARSDREPIVVVPRVFNATGSNVDLAAEASDGSTLALRLGTIDEVTPVRELEVPAGTDDQDGSPLRVLVMLGLLAVLAVPGWLVMKAVFPEAGLSDALGLVPALAAAMLALTGVAVLAVARAPFGAGLEWAAYALSLVLAGLLFLRGRAAAAAR
ncbi:MAG: hypothetical protein M3271_12455, partial [Actinomycetota bacterium]|nr:hypothetical protein [Actinomycetota bacterium]